MRFLVDECLSPHYVGRLAQRGYPDAIHPIHVGLLGTGDHQLVARAIHDDRIIVTANRADFRKLLSLEEVHSGAIIVANLEKEPTWQLILLSIVFVELQPRPADYMVNRVIEVSTAGGVQPYVLSSDDI